MRSWSQPNLRQSLTTDGVVEYAGPVVRKGIPNDTGRVAITCRELAGIWAYRLMFGTQRYRAGRGDYVFTGASVRDVLARAAYHACVSGGGTWDLPVDEPTSTDGAVRTEYWRDNFQTAEAFLDSIRAEDGAPDIFLRPYWASGKLRWKLEVGAPLLSDAVVEVPVATPNHRVVTPVSGLSTTLDYTTDRSGMFAQGQGSEVDMLVAVAGGPVEGFPALDGVEAFKNVSQPARLQRIANGALAQIRGGTKQRDFTLQRDENFDRIVRVGSRVKLRHPGSPIEYPWSATQYVLAVSSGKSKSYAIESQEV